MRLTIIIGAVAAVSWLPTNTRAEDGLFLDLLFNAQALPSFNCISNIGAGFGTVTLGGPRGSRLPQLSASECLRACTEEELFGGIPAGKLGCCESKTDGTCTMFTDATHVYDSSARDTTSWAIASRDVQVCPIFAQNIQVADMVECETNADPPFPDLQCPRDPENPQREEMALKNAAVAAATMRMWSQSSAFNCRGCAQLSDVISRVTPSELPPGPCFPSTATSEFPPDPCDQTKIALTYKTGSPISLFSLASNGLLNPPSDRPTSYSTEWCGCRMTATVMLSSSMTALAPVNEKGLCDDPYVAPSRARRSMMVSGEVSSSSATATVVAGTVGAVCVVLIAAVIIVRRRSHGQDTFMATEHLEDVEVEMDTVAFARV